MSYSRLRVEYIMSEFIFSDILRAIGQARRLVTLIRKR